MADFSTILQTPVVRAIVQENLLERAFHDALAPMNLYRGEASAIPWGDHEGTSQVFTAPGLIPVKARPLRPGQDPTPNTYAVEQWTAEIQQYSDSIDTHMPSSAAAVADMFIRNAKMLGLQAAQSVNHVVRNRMFAAALSGWTVTDGTQGATTSLRVKRLNGFTTARRPDLATGSAVRFDAVSASNPLSITVYDTSPAEVVRSVIGFTPDNSGDIYGPGLLLLSAAVTVADGAYVFSSDRTDITRVGGGNSIRALTPGTDIPTFADVRTSLAKFRQQNVPPHADMRFHAHLDSISESLLFSDDDFQRLMTSLPDMYYYQQFALGQLLGTVFIRNTESPLPDTVVGGTTALFNLDDPFPGELYTQGTAVTGQEVHRILFTAQAAIFEYYSDMSGLVSEAGINGKIGTAQIVNNGVEVAAERIQLIFRGPLNRLQDLVATTWRLVADWPARTDAAVGSAARYKRFHVIEHTT